MDAQRGLSAGPAAREDRIPRRLANCRESTAPCRGDVAPTRDSGLGLAPVSLPQISCGQTPATKAGGEPPSGLYRHGEDSAPTRLESASFSRSGGREDGLTEDAAYWTPDGAVRARGVRGGCATTTTRRSRWRRRPTIPVNPVRPGRTPQGARSGRRRLRHAQVVREIVRINSLQLVGGVGPDPDAVVQFSPRFRGSSRPAACERRRRRRQYGRVRE